MHTQTSLSTPVGEYYLRGVAETACGFKLNEDGTFQFFFSYGALDRYGSGKWLANDSGIVFNSIERPPHDFALLSSLPGDRKAITIKIREAHPMILKHIFCKIKSIDGEQEGITDSAGCIKFKAQEVETIELVFEFCSEKRSIFTINDKAYREFHFKPEPWLMEVFFQDFKLLLTEEGLAGGHPFSTETSFNYEKQVH